MNSSKNKTQATYETPKIVHKGQLKQFAGSPLVSEPADPLDILGLGD